MKKLIATIALITLTLTACTANQPAEEVTPLALPEAETATPEPQWAPNFELSSLSEDPEVCKIKEDSRMRSPGDPVPDFSDQLQIKGKYFGNATAFPFSPTTLPVTGELNVAVIPVDWEDSVGNQQEYDFYKDQAQIFADFWFMVSEGKLKVNLTMPDSWQRMTGSVNDYYMTGEDEGQRYEFRPKKQYLYDGIVAASDENVDYTDIHIVLPVWPKGASVSESGPHEFNFDWNAAMYTNEGDIYNIAGPGDWFLDHLEYGGPWFYFAHEVGHMLGIVHIPSEDHELYKDLDFRQYFWQQNGTNGFDVMGNQDGAVKTIGSWLRWLAGWIDDSQVTCITEESIQDEYFALNHLNDLNGEKEALVIKLSETQVVVVESRRWDERFDRPIVHSRDGIVAYVVDSSKAGAQGSQLMISPRDITKWVEVKHWRGSEELDANFCEGDSANVSNLKIEAVKLTDGQDYVHITKTDTWVDPAGPAIGSVTGEVNRIEDGCVFGPGKDG